MATSIDEPRIRAATDADVSVIEQIVEQAYRHYIPRIGKPPGPMLDDYAVRVSEGVVWVIEEGSTVAGIIVLLPRPDYLLLDNIAVARRDRARGWASSCLPSRRRKRHDAAIARSASTRTGR